MFKYVLVCFSSVLMPNLETPQQGIQTGIASKNPAGVLRSFGGSEGVLWHIFYFWFLFSVHPLSCCFLSCVSYLSFWFLWCDLLSRWTNINLLRGLSFGVTLEKGRRSVKDCLCGSLPFFKLSRLGGLPLRWPSEILSLPCQTSIEVGCGMFFGGSIEGVSDFYRSCVLFQNPAFSQHFEHIPRFYRSLVLLL